jgi:FAD/FMN-containing dehydrogenase
MGVSAPDVAPRPFGAVLHGFAAAVGDSGPVAVAGGQSAWEVGGALVEGTRLVGAPVGVVELVAEEMTVRVGAGTTTAELREALAGAGQEVALPIRPGGTVGGALAVGWSDIRRLGRGPVRDALLEASIVTARGHLVRAGGPTVKNVTGYDLCRLLVGSLGTLGLIGEVVLRTRPRPPSARWFRLRDSLPPPGPLPPTASACLWDGTDLWWLLEGHHDDLARHARTIGASPSDEVEGPPDLPAHRWSLDPSLAWSNTTVFGERFVVEVGVGTVHADQPQPTRSTPAGVRSLGRRMKDTFDPTGRLNPGRDVLAR